MKNAISFLTKMILTKEQKKTLTKEFGSIFKQNQDDLLQQV